jgi:phosphatidylserine/phosphatidylglycerophosphate/cardiolipin synthase-like enzyme
MIGGYHRVRVQASHPIFNPLTSMAELQLRRPDKGRYRIDKLLERKAKDGVKIHIIVYQEVSSKTTPVDSK